ncbi:hypothetical protein VTJ49DRAFT_6968 [Mycothermus thermophilus]|uniref:Uncharacterized protein n=1 Tax=Humicola insolens TaxID=85995 RepID=A0ABR3VI68_HUMIN
MSPPRVLTHTGRHHSANLYLPSQLASTGQNASAKPATRPRRRSKLTGPPRRPSIASLRPSTPRATSKQKRKLPAKPRRRSRRSARLGARRRTRLSRICFRRCGGCRLRRELGSFKRRELDDSCTRFLSWGDWQYRRVLSSGAAPVMKLRW